MSTFTPEAIAKAMAILSKRDPKRPAEVRELGEWDWWQVGAGVTLHAATVQYDAAHDPQGEGTTVCGKTGWCAIPGLFSRMGARRCTKCCDLLGYARGKGSPKNDDRCRPLVEVRIALLRPQRRRKASRPPA